MKYGSRESDRPRAAGGALSRRAHLTSKRRSTIAWGTLNQKETVLVHARFSKDVAIFILERPWHRKQVTEQNADGSVEVKLNVCLSPELEQPHPAVGGACEGVIPRPLIDRMRVAGEALLRDHPASKTVESGAVSG